MRLARQGQAILEGRIEQRVRGIPVHRAAPTADPQLQPLPPGHVDVGEVPGAGACTAGDEDDVVGAIAMEHCGAPAHGAAPAAQTDLGAGRHHLVERRIGDEGVGQPAGIVRVGAGQLHRRRHPGRLRDVGEQQDGRPLPAARLPDETGRRQEPGVRVIAVERRPQTVVQLDGAVVVAGLQSPGQPVGGGGPVPHRPDAVVPGLRAQTDFGTREPHGTAGGGPGRRQLGKFGVEGEVRPPTVPRGASQPAAGVRQPRELDRAATALLPGATPVVHGIEFVEIEAVQAVVRVLVVTVDLVVVVGLEGVRVVGVDIACPQIDRRLELQVRAEFPPDPQPREEQVVPGAVGMGEDLAAVEFQQLHGRHAIADQLVVRNAQRQREMAALPLLRELRQRLAQRTGREIAPAVLLVGPRGHEPTETVLRAKDAAGTQLARPAAERSALQGQVETLRVEAAARIQGDRSAKRVQTEHRVRARQQFDPLRRKHRHKIPGHDVAEDLVDANAVLVQRQPLVGAQEGRRAKAAVEHIGLQGTSLSRRHVNARQFGFEQRAGATGNSSLQGF